MVPKQECDLFITQVIADKRGASGFQFSLKSCESFTKAK